MADWHLPTMASLPPGCLGRDLCMSPAGMRILYVPVYMLFVEQWKVRGLSPMILASHYHHHDRRRQHSVLSPMSLGKIFKPVNMFKGKTVMSQISRLLVEDVKLKRKEKSKEIPSLPFSPIHVSSSWGPFCFECIPELAMV